MIDQENEGFRAYFQHPDGEQYSMVLKGYKLEEAITECRQQCICHHVAFVRLDTWTRQMNYDGGKSLLWCGSESDQWEWVPSKQVTTKKKGG